MTLANSSPSIQVMLGNLYDAFDVYPEKRPLFVSFLEEWAQRRHGHGNLTTQTAIFLAYSCVFDRADDFQLQGATPIPHQSPLSSNLACLRSVSRTHAALQEQGVKGLGARDDGAALAETLRMLKLERPELTFSKPGYLLFLTRYDEFFFGIDPREGAYDTDKTLLRCGLAPNRGEHYLLIKLNHTLDQLLKREMIRRPTPFDGIDGEYFKHPPSKSCAELTNWGTTADLNDFDKSMPSDLDGVPEIVCRALPLSYVEDVISLPSPKRFSKPSHGAFAKKLRTLLRPRVDSWRNVENHLDELIE